MTARGTRRKRPNHVVPGFSGATLALLDEFAHENGVPDPLVRIVLVNGESYLFRGIRVEPSTVVPGCVLIRPLGSPSGYALVVRDEHIVHIDFETASPPIDKIPMGFKAPV